MRSLQMVVKATARLALLGLTAAIVVGYSPASASPYDSVVVFGDSNVDNGNYAAAAAKVGMIVNPPPNFGGRNDNGPVVVEYLSNDLGRQHARCRTRPGRRPSRRSCPNG